MNFNIQDLLNWQENLNNIIKSLGIFSYLGIFLIIFLETGIVIMPFLPGDSLLFAIGVLASKKLLNIFVLWIILCIASILGDTVNYYLGKYFSHKILKIKYINKNHLEKAEKFYEKHGGKAIILARFIPIIRTFAPFVAGISKMNYSKFITYNIIGGISWVSIFLLSGYFFGEIPIVKNNFEIVIILVILISVMPVILEYFKSRNEKN